MAVISRVLAFDRWPTHRSYRALRRAFQVKELQACRRVFAPSRRDHDRDRTLVFPHLFALLHRPLPLLWCSWISAEFPFRLSSNLFLLSMCIDALGSTTNSRSSGDFASTVLRLLVWLTVNLSVPAYALCAEFASRFRFVILTSGWMPIINRGIRTLSFQSNVCTLF